MKSSAISVLFSSNGREDGKVSSKGVGNALKGRKGENRIRKLNVLYLEKESGNGHSFLLICFFLFFWIFCNFCFDFF